MEVRTVLLVVKLVYRHGSSLFEDTIGMLTQARRKCGGQGQRGAYGMARQQPQLRRQLGDARGGLHVGYRGFEVRVVLLGRGGDAAAAMS